MRFVWLRAYAHAAIARAHPDAAIGSAGGPSLECRFRSRRASDTPASVTTKYLTISRKPGKRLAPSCTNATLVFLPETFSDDCPPAAGFRARIALCAAARFSQTKRRKFNFINDIIEGSMLGAGFLCPIFAGGLLAALPSRLGAVQFSVWFALFRPHALVASADPISAAMVAAEPAAVPAQAEPELAVYASRHWARAR